MKKFPSGASVEIYETLDSTSAEAKRRAAANETGPVWILAQRQTAGYGRRGRIWEQDAGDFAGSLLFTTDASRNALGQLSFIAALSVYEAIAGLIDKGELQIKWPNDILIGKAKVAGLLLEMLEGEKAPALILGVGVNIVSRPEGLAYPTARLLDHGLAASVSPADFAQAIDRNFWAHHKIWREKGFGEARTAWLERAAGLGKPITVRLPNETVSGVFAGLDETGGLILRFEGGTRIINAGDVFFGGPDANGI